MSRRLRARWPSVVFAGVAVYVIFLIAAPFDHHDLLCHLRTPLHCTSCTSSPLGFVPAPQPAVRTPILADAGHVFAPLLIARDLLLSVRSTGRSPPTA